MTDENVKVCGGILLIRSESGRSKLEKVLVQTKPGKTKSRVKCRIERFIKEKMSPLLSINHKEAGNAISKIMRSSDKCDSFIMHSLPTSRGDFEIINERKASIHKKITLETETEFLNKSVSSNASCSFQSKASSSAAKIQEEIASLFIADSKTKTLYENEGIKQQDSTLHFAYSGDDFEADEDDLPLASLTKFQKNKMVKDATIVMSQYSTTLHKPDQGDQDSEPEDEEDFEFLESDSDASYEEENKKFLISGLRRIRSDESRLYIRPILYKPKRAPPPDPIDGVVGVLEKVPSDVFVPPKIIKKEKRKEKSEETLKMLSIEDLPTDESSDEDVISIERWQSKESEIDTRPLERLKELEDTTFTISTTGLADVVPKVVPLPSKTIKKKDDFCVHNKDLPIGDQDFSSSEFKPQKKKRKSSIFRIFKKKEQDFCVHTADPEGTDYSLTALEKSDKVDFCIHTADPAGNSDYSISKKNVPEINATPALASSQKKLRGRRSSEVNNNSPADQKKFSKRSRSSTRSLPTREPSIRSRSSSKSSSQHSRNISTITLIDNKEARRSKHSKTRKSSQNL